MIISEMQHKLATWAESDPNRRFGRLLRLINVAMALAKVEWRAVCAERCAVQNGELNPCRRQEKLGEMLLGQPSYLMAKVYGDKSMTVKRGFGRTCQTQCPARPARYGQG